MGRRPGRVSLSLSLSLSACESRLDATEPEEDASVRDAGATPIHICTQGLDELRSACRSTPETDVCLRLGDDDPQIARQAHLEVVLAEEPLLGQLRFRHGRWAGQSVSELVSDLARNPAITVPLSTAVELAFSGCVDHRVLGRATRSSVCDAAGGGFVEGVEEAPCVGLDHACGRGYFDEVRGCCDINTSVEGAVCDAPLGTGAWRQQ